MKNAGWGIALGVLMIMVGIGTWAFVGIRGEYQLPVCPTEQSCPPPPCPDADPCTVVWYQYAWWYNKDPERPWVDW